MLRYERITADIPGRFEAEAGMGFADAPDRLLVAVAIRCFGNAGPVRRLPPFGGLHMAGRRKEAARLRVGSHLVIKDSECGADFAREERLEVPQILTGRGIETDEVEAVLERHPGRTRCGH
jgi:hypothetical protein